MKFIVILSAILLVFQANSPTVKSSKIKWKKYKTEEELKKIIFKVLPENPSITEVTKFLEAQKLYYSIQENVIYASSKSWTCSFMISKCWLLEFHFDSSGIFKKFVAKTALTGP